MQWIHNFQLFLFDFDGLLVDTEPLHYQSYVNMLARRGHTLQLTFTDFLRLAHSNATAWKEALYEAMPDLEPDWAVLYREKKETYLELLAVARVELMPGVEPLLYALERANIRRCVVTHSIAPHVQWIRARIPALATLPNWITREDYKEPKPHPECYLKAIELYGRPGDRIVGFEDSLRGLKALQQTPALPVLISPHLAPENVTHFKSFEDVSHI